MTYAYNINAYTTDHLMSTRGAKYNVSDSAYEDYYSFGKGWENPAYSSNFDKYTYNGKEMQTTGWLPYLDYGARMYDPRIGRWFGADPLAEKYLSTSPYAFCANNPINLIDMFGLQPQLPHGPGADYNQGTGNWDIDNVVIYGTRDWTGELWFASNWLRYSNSIVNVQSSISTIGPRGGGGGGIGSLATDPGEIRPYKPNFFGRVENIANKNLLGRMLYGMVDDAVVTIQSFYRTYPSHLNNNIVNDKDKLSAGINTLSGLMFNNFSRFFYVPTKTVNVAQFNRMYRGTGINAATRNGAAIRQYNYVIKNTNDFNAKSIWVGRFNGMFGAWYDENY